MRWPEKISAPVLIMHGGADLSCPPEQSLRMGEALQIFHGEGHVLAGRAEERDRDAIRWFERFR